MESILTRAEAIDRVLHWLNAQTERSQDVEYAITTVYEKPYGFVLTYQDRRYVEHGDRMHRILGARPVVVEKEGGQIHRLKVPADWSRRPHAEQIALYDHHRIALNKPHHAIDFTGAYETPES